VYISTIGQPKMTNWVSHISFSPVGTNGP